MQELASRHVVWVRALLLIVTTTFVLVVGSGAAYAQITVNTDDLAEEVVAPIQEAAEEVAAPVEETVRNVTGGAGDALNDVTNGAGDALNDVTNGAGSALNDVTDGVGPVLKEVTDPVGGVGDNGAGLPETRVAGVIPVTDDPSRPTVGGSGLDGNSISVSQRVSENPFSMENAVIDDLPAVVQAPGSALADSVVSPGDASAGSFELPFGLGTLPFTGVQLALFMVVALTTACVGWMMVRFTRIIEARDRGSLEAQTVT